MEMLTISSYISAMVEIAHQANIAFVTFNMSKSYLLELS